MKRTIALGLVMFASVTLATSFPAIAADPTLHQVYQAAEAGNLKQAESMMDQVLHDHPNSAKAHFVEAELLAKEGRLDMARAELATAERLEPGVPFAKPESVRELNARLNTPARSTPSTAPSVQTPATSEIPWGMLMLGALLIGAVMFFIRSLNRPRIIPAPGTGVSPYGVGGGMAQPYGAGGVGTMGPTGGVMSGGGMGSGILGGLATGVAVGAGVVAGEALMHRVMDGGHQADAAPAAPVNSPLQSNDDMGGSDFGIADGGSWDDASGGGSSGGDDWS